MIHISWFDVDLPESVRKNPLWMLVCFLFFFSFCYWNICITVSCASSCASVQHSFSGVTLFSLTSVDLVDSQLLLAFLLYFYYSVNVKKLRILESLIIFHIQAVLQLQQIQQRPGCSYNNVLLWRLMKFNREHLNNWWYINNKQTISLSLNLFIPWLEQLLYSLKSAKM